MAHATRTLLTALALMTLIIACEDGQTRNEVQTEEAPDPRLFGTEHLAPRVIAERYLRGMADEARVYWERHQETWDPSMPGLSFPMSAPMTPAVMPCGTAVMVNPVDWAHPTWRALHFPPPDPLRFSCPSSLPTRKGTVCPSR